RAAARAGQYRAADHPRLSPRARALPCALSTQVDAADALARCRLSAAGRGPWVGAAAMLLAFVATGPRAVTRLAKLAAGGLCVVPLLMVSPVGQALLDYLPFVG